MRYLLFEMRVKVDSAFSFYKIVVECLATKLPHYAYLNIKSNAFANLKSKLS